MLVIMEIFMIMIAVILCDLVFFYFVKDIFNNQVNMIQGTPIIFNQKLMVGALITYIVIASGFYKFIVLEKKTWVDAFLLGIFAYGIYEFTNYSLFSKWQLTTCLLDTLWGGVLFTLVFFIHQKFLRKV
jgi:uncharacterized membrane protein